MAKEKKQRKTGMVGKVVKTVLSVLLCIVLIGVTAAVNMLLPSFDRMANSILGGFDIRIDNSKANTDGLDLQYNKCDYTAQTITAAEEDLKTRIANEGVVLLMNDGVLPKSADTTFSFVSVNSATVRPGSGMMGGGADMKTLFANAGVGFNAALYDFYAEQSSKGYGLASGSISYGDAEDFRINEVPLSVMQDAEGIVDSIKGTVPVYFMKRVAGEGRDMPRSMYSHADNPADQAKSYLEPDSTELEILQYLNDNYDEVVLVINSNAALELNWLSRFPSIKAILLAPDGLTALPGILTGAVNPSARTVDTWAADASASPAAQNFGDYQYSDASGALTKYNYVTYQEGIYVGYKYYETRYEDVVLNQGNAGDFDYDSEVVFPFGYGLSYTTFGWSNFSANWDGDTCTVTVDVTNTGSLAGKEVVEIYAQSPYTEYDKANLVEKSAVSLVGFGKTALLAPGATETVSVSFSREQLKAYDAYGAKTFILDAGDYYVTAAQNAHAAINNILCAKGASVDGDASFADVYTVSAFDADTYSVDSYSGASITNCLDHTRGDSAYLSRQDWVGTFPTHDGVPSMQVSTWGNEINGSDGVSYTYTKTASAELIAKLDSFDSGSPVDPASFTDKPVYGAKNGLTLIDMRGLDFDDPLWDKLLDELTAEDYYNTIGMSGYGSEYIASIQKPFCIDADTAAGLIYGGTGAMFPNPMTVAQTWNLELADEYGLMIGNEALLGGANGWYAPSMNIHRTPYSGRNGEYYSEDGFLSGAIASREVKGAASKGMYAFIKHFAFNDQEDHRGDRDGQFSVATWLNEQSAREIYLVPFEMCMKVGNVEMNYVEKLSDGSFRNATREIRACQAIMTSFNRAGATWAGGDYNLITGIVRNEWAFNGYIMTDNANTGVFMDGYQMTEAGADVKLTNQPESARYNFDQNDPATYHYARAAMHRMLYIIANSNAMNGMMPGSIVTDGMRLTTKIQIGVTAVSVVLIGLMGWFTFRRFTKKETNVQ